MDKRKTIWRDPRSTAATAAFQTPLLKKLITDFMDQGDIYVGTKLVTTTKQKFEILQDADQNIITVYITAKKSIIEYFAKEFTRVFGLYVGKELNAFCDEEKLYDIEEIQEVELQRAGYVCKKIEFTMRFVNRYRSFYWRHIQIYDQIQNFFFNGDWNGGSDIEININTSGPKRYLMAKYDLITKDVKQVMAKEFDPPRFAYVGFRTHGIYTRDYVSMIGYEEGVHKHGIIYREVHKRKDGSTLRF
jgi:hypothetical protein